MEPPKEWVVPGQVVAFYLVGMSAAPKIDVQYFEFSFSFRQKSVKFLYGKRLHAASQRRHITVRRAVLFKRRHGVATDGAPSSFLSSIYLLLVLL